MTSKATKVLENIVSFYRKYNLKVNENSFNPTPKLKSSPVPILFIPFNESEMICNFCGNKYSEASYLRQKFCKNCLSKYLEDDNASVRNIEYNTCLLNNFNDNNNVIYLNAHIEYENTSIKCVKYFNQVISKSMPLGSYFESCSCCYKIFSGWIGSTSPISILYLPWWDVSNSCIVCNRTLEFKTDCQKWCSYCIIIYTGCRHCLTTNIIFGITGESQYIYKQISNYMNNTDKNSNPLELYKFIKNLDLIPLKPLIRWSSYDQITSLLGNNENSLNQIPNLPIMFIPFNNNEDKCHYCNMTYYVTPSLKQKYCRYCLNLHIKFITKNTKYTIKDVHYICDIINTHDHNPDICAQVIKWGEIRTTILFFDKITSIDSEYKLCSNCYKISFECVKSTLIEKTIPILYLPWWDAYNQCIVCNKLLGFEAEGGFGIIYQALINGNVVAIKKILNSQEPNKYFLNELKSLYQCYDSKFECIIKCHGITKDPITKELMFIMKYANGGDLHNYLQENFAEITWKKKLHILWRISDGLQTIHEKDFVHRDFHSGNILIEIIENDSSEEIRLELIKSKMLGPTFNEKPHPKAIYTSRSLSSLTGSPSIITFNTKPNNKLIEESINKKEYITKEYEFDINEI
ncbi:kinase-like domain-containing protein [Rhizophagus irregularis DAOM 181602=DAOM 197198]|nr:kinase-like domain-containing protein [Rhizophagus irregularis DAOM 181602=DAOM 197198]